MTEYLAPGVFLTEVAFRSQPIDGVPTSPADSFAVGVVDRSSGPLSNDQPADWTTQNTHDPGVTLLELVAWVTESLSSRCDPFPLHASVVNRQRLESRTHPHPNPLPQAGEGEIQPPLPCTRGRGLG